MSSEEGKMIIFTAPSGAGKTTIVHHLLKTFPQLAFSVSATSRAPRGKEAEGRDYYFLSPEKFRELISEGAFLEWEEVYENQYYGTLYSEVERIWKEGKHILFDIDVRGAFNLVSKYPDRSLSVFVKPPSPEILFERLRGRQTETPEQLRKRITKAKQELSFENEFDEVLVNDSLEKALQDAEQLVRDFLGLNQ